MINSKGYFTMNFLRFLEGLRTPVGDIFFSTITHLGEETIFIVVGLLYFWCINKKQGYFILSKAPRESLRRALSLTNN